MGPAACIVLAAGASTRLGRPKQLLRYQGESLLGRACRAAQEAGFAPVIAVLGAYAPLMEEALSGTDVQLAYNSDWESGMGSSVRAGLSTALQTVPKLQAACFVLTDQPYLSAELLSGMRQKLHQSTAPGIAASYNGVLGVPAIFRAALFAELLALDGQKGAKAVLRRHREALLAHDFPLGQYDIDRPADWERFQEE